MFVLVRNRRPDLTDKSYLSNYLNKTEIAMNTHFFSSQAYEHDYRDVMQIVIVQ